MHRSLLRLVDRIILRPVSQLLDAPARLLTRWSDEVDEVWEPFLDDGLPALATRPLAA